MDGEKTQSFTVISRTDWGARPPRCDRNPFTEAKALVFLSHTCLTPAHAVTDQEEASSIVKSIQNYHMGPDKKWADIGYNFLIDEGGHVYEGRGWDIEGAHTYRYNNLSYGVAIIGDFTSRSPSDAAIQALEQLLAHGIKQKKLTPDYKLHGLRDARDTASPGEHFYHNWVCKHQRWGGALHKTMAQDSTPIAQNVTTTCIEEDKPFAVISRSDWGARPPRSDRTQFVGPKSMVFLNHTCHRSANAVTDQDEGSSVVKSIQNYHMGPDKKWADIGYNFLIDEGGHVYEGRGWDIEGAHTYRYNNLSYGVAIVGDFSERSPSDSAVQALEQLLAYGVNEGKLTAEYKLYGHCDAQPSTSPGEHFHKSWVAKHPRWGGSVV